MSRALTPTELNMMSAVRDEAEAHAEYRAATVRCSCDCCCIQRIYPDSGVMCARCLDGDCPFDVELGEDGYPDDDEWVES